ncbi:MAG: hypothetical protein ABIT71_08960 [Vicinamibacteraceae bacterium]
MAALSSVVRRSTRGARVAALAACAVLAGAASVASQGLGTSRVTALTSTIYARCDPASPARLVLERGAVVSIEAVNEAWVSVRTAGGETGCMRRSDLAPTTAIDRGAQARRVQAVAQARSGAARGPSSAAALKERVFASVNASYLTASRTLDDSRTFSLNAETASFTSDYAVEPSVGLDAGAIVRFWKGLGAGVAFTRHSDSRDIDVEASLPHPLKFNSPRTVAGTVAGDHEETAVHIQIAYIVPVGKKNRLSVVAFGGPSFFTVKQSVVTAVQFREDYPYDEATFAGATVASEEEKTTGFNVGVDVGYYFTRNVGVGGLVRFSSAATTFSLGDVDAGGALVGGGVRLRF